VRLISALPWLLLPSLLVAGCCDEFLGRPAAAPRVQPITIPVTAPKTAPEPTIGLFVAITTDGLTVGSPMAVLTPESGGDGPTLPCTAPGCPTADSYDYSGLTELLTTVKVEYPDERQLLVKADENVDYEVVVRVLDAARSRGDRELFPEVALQVTPPASGP
jgi:hypothetical protein